MLKKHDLGITPYIENISSRDQSLVRMGTSRVTLQLSWPDPATDCEHFSTEQPRCRRLCSLARVMIALASRLSHPITKFALKK